MMCRYAWLNALWHMTEGSYRQHRCGVTGPHQTHVCRYCGKENR